MIIEIYDTDIEARLAKQINAIGGGTAVRALEHLLETQEEQDRWLLENRAIINSRIRCGIEQLERGEPDEQLERLKRLSG